MKNKLYILAFLEGFYFLVFELLGVQLIQPNYGNSYFIWITVLSVAMLCSAIGYWLGGKLSNNEGSVKYFLFISGTIISLWLIGYYKINESLFVGLQSFSLINALIIQTAVLIGIPVALTTSFSPILIAELKKNTPIFAPSTVFYISTFGGVTAVYLLAFFLLPNSDIITLIYIFGGISAVVFATILVFNGRKVALAGHLAFVIIAVLILSKNQTPKLEGKNTKIIKRTHGIMGEIEIREEFGQYRHLLVNRMIQSNIQIQNGESAMGYPYRISYYASVFPAGSKVLVGGLGGGALINQFVSLGFDVEAVDIDKRLFGISKAYMNLTSDFKFVADDIRHYINTTDQKYDIIVLDLSKGEVIPTDVFTVETFEAIRNILKPNGAVYINYFSNSNDLGISGINSVLNTIKTSGFEVGVIKKAPEDVSVEDIIVATNKIELNKEDNFRFRHQMLDRMMLLNTDYLSFDSQKTDKGSIFTDDNNQLEVYQFEVISDFRAKSRHNEYITFYKN